MTEKYLKEHGLNKEFVTKTLGWVLEENRITIPIYDADGKNPFNRYRNLEEGSDKFTADKGSHPTLYRLYKVKKENTIMLCEGEPDCAKLWQEGIPAITSTSGVKSFSTKIAAPLKGKMVLICLDTDEAGISAVAKYFNVLTEVGANPLIIDLPPEYKDICDFFTSGKTKEDFDSLTRFPSLENWEIKHEPEEYSWQSADDILKKVLPEEKWLLHKIIPISGFCFFIGPEASGKSFYALTIAKSIITGEPWLEQFEVKKKTKVLIIDKENTIRRIQDRLRGLEIKGDDIYWLAYPQYLEVADRDRNSESGYTEFFESVARKVKEKNIGLIILDSFTDIFVGEENDRGDIQKFFDAFRQMFLEVAILGIHHSGKLKPGIKAPTSQLARGSTNIMAQTYTAFHCEPVRKSKAEFTIEQTKAGDSLRMDKFLIEIQTIPDPLHPEETLVIGFKYKGEVQDKEEKFQEALELFEDTIIEAGRIPRKELQEQFESEGISSATFSRVLSQLKEDGKIKMEKSLSIKRGSDIVWIGPLNDIYEE